jgi:hypothetical protein
MLQPTSNDTCIAVFVFAFKIFSFGDKSSWLANPSNLNIGGKIFLHLQQAGDKLAA